MQAQNLSLKSKYSTLSAKCAILHTQNSTLATLYGMLARH